MPRGGNNNPNGASPRCTAKQVSEALLKSDGNLTAAASKLGVTRQAVYNYIKRYDLQSVLDQARENMVDEAVGQLHKLVRDGNLGATIFYLKTQAKGRGFTERIEQTGANGEPIEYRQIKTEGRPGIDQLKEALAGNRVAEYADDDD